MGTNRSKLSWSDEVIDIYFGEYLRDLDVDSKKRVIAKFVESLVTPPPPLDQEPRRTLAETLGITGGWEGPFPPEWKIEEEEEEFMQSVVGEPQLKYKRPDDKEQ